HRSHPSSVIYGRYPCAEPEPMTPFFRFLDSLGHDGARGVSGEFVEVPVVASGQISVERGLFEAGQGVYRDDLATPAAEEYELSLRLRDRGIRILLAPQIVAIHNRSVEIESMCLQAYTHAMGCAEAVAKDPRTLDLRCVREMIQANGTVTRR